MQSGAGGPSGKALRSAERHVANHWKRFCTVLTPQFFAALFLKRKFGYNNAITYNCEADSKKLTLPLGLTVGRTFLLSSGDGLDLSIGAYALVERP